MRLWHYKLLSYLPKSQLLAQWREVNAIFKNKPKHILINYVYTYPKDHLRVYTLLLLKEMANRKINFNSRSLNNFFDWFPEYESDPNLLGYHISDISRLQTNLNVLIPFYMHHNNRYLLQCYYNLEEKFDRKQKDFSQNEFDRLHTFVKKETKKL